MKNAGTAFHEAGHAVVARLCDVAVIRAEAGETSRVSTHFRLGPSAEEAAATLEKLALIDLAGQAAECRWLRGAAWAGDEGNAIARVLRVVCLRRGLPADAELDDNVQAEAAELLENLYSAAAQLVEVRWPSIERVAQALDGGRTLDQAAIDALIGART